MPPNGNHRSSPAYRRHWKALPGKATKSGQPPWSAPPLKPSISWASCRFLSEDLSDLVKLMPESDAKIHYLSSAHGIFDMLHQSQIHFSAPDEAVLACIQILYLSILHIDQIGLSFFPALRMLVVGACAELVV